MQDLATSAHNIANLRTAKPTSGDAVTGQTVVRTERAEGGVESEVVDLTGNEEGVVLPEPTHPDADAAGNVRYPDIDLGSELLKIQMAQRSVEASTASIDAAVDTYRDLLAMTDRDRERLTATYS